MRILLAARHRKSLEPYLGFLREAGRRGHETTVTLQERDDKTARVLGGIPGIRVAAFPHQRRDAWHDTAVILRAGRDYLQYLLPPYARARKLRARALQRLFDQLDVEIDARGEAIADGGLRVPGPIASRLTQVAQVIEHAIPADGPHVAFIRDQHPDVVLVTPLVHFGSAQADVVKAAQAIGVPVAMHVFSWDNLSTKGALHVAPDRVFAWNETQRAELADLHGYPPDRVELVGAPRFDDFAAMRPVLTREAFDRSLGFDSTRPTVLYLCSSKLVSEREARFVREWIHAVRGSADPTVRDANLLIRPHPDVPALEPRWVTAEREVRWADERDVELHVCELFGQPRTVLVRSDRGSARTLMEMLAHSAVAVGLNTSAEIEAGIAGRPVLTIMADEKLVDGQQTTLHFHYLRESAGGFVRVGESIADHLVQLREALEAPPSPDAIRARVGAFIRPLGWDVTAAVALTDAVERLAAAGPVQAAARTAVREPIARIDTPSSAPAEAAPRLVEVLGSRLAAGEIFYDVGAGTGAVSIALARTRGITAYAFESGIASVAALWDEVVRTGSDGAVVPLPLLPGARTMLRQEALTSSSAGAARTTPRRHRWREHEGRWSGEVTQPVLAMPLDHAMKTWDLPVPHALRLALGDATAECLEGARGLLAASALRTIMLECPAAEQPAAHTLLTTAGWTRDDSAQGGGHTLWTRAVR